MKSFKSLKKSVLLGGIFIFFLTGLTAEKKMIVEIKKILSIADDGINFYFKYPSLPVIDKYGSIYITDDKQLLKFDQAGSFQGNYYRHGLGPGELNNLLDLFIQGDFLIAYNWSPGKFLWFSLKDIKLIKEEKISQKIGWANYLTFYKNKYFFFKERFPLTKNKAVFIDIKVNLLSYDLGNKSFFNEELSYKKKYFISKTETRSSIKNVNFVQVGKINEHQILIANTGKYAVLLLNLDKMQISTFVRKDYRKVRVKKEWKKHFRPFKFVNEGPQGEELKEWIKPDLDDIQKIFRFGSKIWLVTSTFREKDRLVNIDVYNFAGEYINSFWLRLPKNIVICRINLLRMIFFKQHLYIFVRNTLGDYELARYCLVKLPSWAR